MSFGWNPDYRDSEIERVYHYFYEGADIPDRSAELYELILSEVSPYFYDQSCSADFDFGSLILQQWEKREFYNSGSEQSYKKITLDKITEEEYNKAKEVGIFEKPGFVIYQKAWFEKLEDFFFVKAKSIYERYDVYAKDLLGLGYVKLTAED